jgi:hypothetical protein
MSVHSLPNWYVLGGEACADYHVNFGTCRTTANPVAGDGLFALFPCRASHELLNLGPPNGGVVPFFRLNIKKIEPELVFLDAILDFPIAFAASASDPPNFRLSSGA